MNDLLNAILDQYVLDPDGFHGVDHWARVLENGLWLAGRTPGARIEVVRLFAYFHDARRENEGIDDDHGARGAELARAFRGEHFDLSDEDMDLLETACALHTAGLTDGDPTRQVCWDADRLDLGRVGIDPRPEYLCTSTAKRDYLDLRFDPDRDMTGPRRRLRGEADPAC